MLTMLVGQHATLTYLPEQAGLDPADVTGVQWQQQSGGANVKFTAPDLVEALAPGFANMRCRITAVGGETLTYKFQIESRTTEPAAVVIPVILQPTVPPA